MQNPMLSLDIGTSTTKGEIATSPWQTRATSDPSSLKNNSPCHSVELHSQLQLSATLSSWIFSSFITTFAHPLPLIPFPRHIYSPLLPPTGHSTTVVYSAITIGFTSQTQMTSDSKSSSTNMITSSLGTPDKTKPSW
jgi:hypothetical protein